jgi:hypothetical protein
MKKSIPFVAILFMLFASLLSGCATEPDPDPSPTDARTAFLGRWSVVETPTKLTYEVNITTDPNSTDGVFISNFGNTGSGSNPAAATIGGKTITLDPNQTIGEGWIINGYGNLSTTTRISWNYSINDGADVIYYIATYTKR